MMMGMLSDTSSMASHSLPLCSCISGLPSLSLGYVLIATASVVVVVTVVVVVVKYHDLYDEVNKKHHISLYM